MAIRGLRKVKSLTKLIFIVSSFPSYTVLIVFHRIQSIRDSVEIYRKAKHDNWNLRGLNYPIPFWSVYGAVAPELRLGGARWGPEFGLLRLNFHFWTLPGCFLDCLAAAMLVQVGPTDSPYCYAAPQSGSSGHSFHLEAFWSGACVEKVFRVQMSEWSWELPSVFSFFGSPCICPRDPVDQNQGTNPCHPAYIQVLKRFESSKSCPIC